MSTPACPPLKLDLWTIRSKCSRIIEAHSRHFNAVLLLFVLPFSISLSLYPFLIIQLFPRYFFTLTIKPLVFNFLCFLSISIFFLLSTASITYSIFHGYYDRPIKLLSSIKAAFTSLFPLLLTFFLQVLIISGISLFLGLLFFSQIKATQFLGFQVNYFSTRVMSLVYVTILMIIVVYLQVNWIIAYVIVVLESSWGFEPLKRSQHLVKGLEGVAFKIVLLFGFISSINMWQSVARITSGVSDGGGGVEWESWIFVMNILASSMFYMAYMLFILPANTILYIYSKAQHVDQIAEEFAREYVSLPFDDGKVPRVFSIV